jgi:hypothetical protein
MVFDDPLDRNPATPVVDSQISDMQQHLTAVECQWEITPGLTRRYGEYLVLTHYVDGTLTAFVYEEWEDAN